ncbi:sulfatase-like hydrolase/transferase [bacterium]|nr:sulfatase-like hydrolase/transferase [bacterium]
MEENNSFPMSVAIKDAYRCGEEEEGMGPICLVKSDNSPIGRICSGDYVIFYDIRGEREIELTQAFTSPGFDRFPININLRTKWVTMIQYDSDLNVKVAFPPLGLIHDTLSEVVSNAGMRQIKITESEKSTHITYFMNGKREDTFPGEDRDLIPSPADVKNFDQSPQMSCAEVTDKIIEAIRGGGYDLICANLANIDVVGHIENRDAIIEAVRTVDHHIGRIVKEARAADIFTVVVADHGTVEKWYYPDGKIDTGHTDSPVPFMIISPDGKQSMELIHGEGGLIDVAPTVLHMLGLSKPDVMTGKSLINSCPSFQSGLKVLLLIVDGWGYNPSNEGNLIAAAQTKVMNSLMEKNPWMCLSASGESVGLPADTVGNSESGHLHLGAGRIVPSDRVRIENSIKDGSFYSNNNLLWAIRGAINDGTNLHLIGIVSFYSSHGSIDYLFALMEMAKNEGLDRVFIHSFLGRRGERPESGAYYVRQIEEKTKQMGTGRVVSVIGRYWALDREHNWDRIEKTYNLIVNGKGRRAIAKI